MKIKGRLRLGNNVLVINNAIYICEILLCKTIIIDSSLWYIKKKIFYSKFNMTIEPSGKGNCSDPEIVCVSISDIYSYRYMHIPLGLRFNVFQEEFLSNVEKFQSDPNDLYIHLGSGDVFSPRALRIVHPEYSQPPLCFYESIINNYNFRKIFIISENKNNPLLDILLKMHPNMIYSTNSVQKDTAHILNAYNFIPSTSSFSRVLIKLSNKLKMVFEYNGIIKEKSQKIRWLDYDYQKYIRNFTVIRMNASNKYKTKIYPWISSKEQLNLMINETCINKFDIIHSSYK